MSYDRPGHIRSKPNGKEASSSYGKTEGALLAGMTATFSWPPQVPVVPESQNRYKLVSRGNLSGSKFQLHAFETQILIWIMILFEWEVQKAPKCDKAGL